MRYRTVTICVAVIAACAAIWLLARRSPPPRDDWDAMQEALSEPSRIERPPTAFRSPPPEKSSASRPAPPDEPPPGGPFASAPETGPPAPGVGGFDVLLMGYVDAMEGRGDIDIFETGHAMLRSPLPSDRIAGAALLSRLGLLDIDAIPSLAADQDLSVPIQVLGWLRDHADAAMAGALVEALLAEGPDVAKLAAMVTMPELSPSGRRALIEVLADTADETFDVSEILVEVTGDRSQSLDVRAKAAVELRGTVPPEELAAKLVATLSAPTRTRTSDATSSSADTESGKPPKREEAPPGRDPAWEALRERLTRDLNMPPELMGALGEVTVHDLEEWTAAGTLNIQLLETATRLEWVLRQPDIRIQPGVVDSLLEYFDSIESGEDLPPEMEVLLHRIKSRIPDLTAAEAESGDHAFSNSGPPGAVTGPTDRR